ncbi:hypothetical protein [Ekhidna sp.]|uniref:hypothetical protein n=1 Tax=Ekhidna sp. TaxID=2608089 RepID=UPI0032EF0AEA
MKTLKESFKRQPFLLITLSIICVLFLIKGSVYLSIGSPIPFFLSIFFLLLLGFALYKPNRIAGRIIGFFGILMILWGFTRLLFAVLFTIAPLTEAHIQEQFSIIGNIISLAVLLTGIYTLKKAKNYSLD